MVVPIPVPTLTTRHESIAQRKGSRTLGGTRLLERRFRMGWHSFQRQLMILESKPKSTKHPSQLAGETGIQLLLLK